MTADELVALINEGPAKQLIAALGPLSEAERKTLLKPIVALRKERTRRKPREFLFSHRPVDYRLKLALFALGSFADVRGHGCLFDCEGEDSWLSYDTSHLLQVLRDRRPAWLQDWVEGDVSRPRTGSFSFVRKLVREGLCQKPTHDEYVEQMIWGGVQGNHREFASTRDAFLADPDLLDDEIWRLFDVTAPSVDLFLMVPGREESPRCLARTLRDFAAEGRLDRKRLLACSLRSILRNRTARDTNWTRVFHEMLVPTVLERAELQPAYLDLLSHPVAALALDALAVLQKAKMLDASSFVRYVAPIFLGTTKGPSLVAIRILRAVAKAEPSLGAEIAEVAVRGLVHPVPDVQKELFDLIEQISPDCSGTIRDALSAQISLLAPTIGQRAKAWLATNSEGAAVCDEPEIDGVIARARSVPAEWRERSGIDAILAAIESNGPLPPLEFQSMDVSQLSDETRVPPIADLDELLQRLTIAIEGLDHPIEFELLLDGISRHCDRTPTDVQPRLAPLVARIAKLAPSHVAHAEYSIGYLRTLVFRVIYRWQGAERTWSAKRPRLNDIFDLLAHQVEILLQRIAERKALPLLACPTHRAGWIDPAILLERLTWYQQHKHKPADDDFAQAILRLAPDRRAEILRASKKITGIVGDVFRYALGGALPPLDGIPKSLLVTAGRARDPLGTLDDLAPLDLPPAPDAAVPATYSWKAHGKREPTMEERVFDYRHFYPDLAKIEVHVRPEVPRTDEFRHIPSVAMHNWRMERRLIHYAGDIGEVKWAATVWPANLQSFFVNSLMLRPSVYLPAVWLRQRAHFLEPLFGSDVPFVGLAPPLLAAALSTNDPAVAGLAADLIIDMVRDGRATGDEIGVALHQQIDANYAQLSRVAKNLANVGTVSPLHALACSRIAQRSLAGLASAPKEMHAILAALLEWLTTVRHGVDDGLRPLLERPLSGKAAKLAKSLLALPHDPTSATHVEALKGRVERALRWQAAADRP